MATMGSVMSQTMVTNNNAYVENRIGKHIPYQYKKYEMDFDNFVTKYDKSYPDFDTYLHRLSVFAHNVEKILSHNMKEDYKMAINQFADLESHEFHISGYNHQKKLMAGSSCTKADLSAIVPKDELDWVSQGAVTQVKNQGSCGSCWAFSTTGSIEGANAIATGSLVELSEQELVDCDKTDSGCNGGLMDDGFMFAMENGLCSETAYPYKASDEQCQESSCTSKVKVTGCHDVPADEESLMKAVNIGPVSVAIEADQFAFQFYSSGILRKTKRCGTNLDHGVLLVGYGTEAGVDYWKVKNSWGESWGESGYIRLERNYSTTGLCGIAMQASYPVVDNGLTDNSMADETMTDVEVTYAKTIHLMEDNNLKVTIQGNLSKQIDSGNINIKVDGLIEENFDLQANSGNTFPIAPDSNVSLDISYAIPKFAPRSEYKGHIVVTDQDNAVVTQFDFDIVLASMDQAME
jgi:C1A family cysteine protease